MPLNCELGWGQAIASPPCSLLSPQNTCFQIFGTKRKSSKNEQGEDGVSNVSKRQCHGLSYSSTAFKEVNHPVQSYQEKQPIDVVTHAPEQMECMQSEENSSYNNNILQSSSRELNKDEIQFLQDMNMESNDYWCAPMSNLSNALRMHEDVEEARMRMESDYTPNTAQYITTPADNIPPFVGYDQNMPGRIRCYCKPILGSINSWL
uniref:Uncharacterized protein LOC100369309 isoform X2 n=1 Tax=Saccoglossus kowalevskii TaxID=10224 RepID=A0ABM0M3G1_SACKO|nr:PREDICTED: uncharacterized protein LOC100369309 isoform X2 [Saccoglossus kowalevskii]